MTKLNPHVAQRIELLKPQFGPARSAIAGSKYVRWYCVMCGEPMRVSPKPWPPPISDCERCAGRHGQIAAPASARADDVSGYQANAIRAMEGG